MCRWCNQLSPILFQIKLSVKQQKSNWKIGANYSYFEYYFSYNFLIFLSRKNKTKQNANSIVTCKTFLWYATHRNTLCLYTKPKILILTELIVFFKIGENQSFHFFQLLATALMTEQYSMTGREKENWKLIFTFTQHQTAAAAAASVSSAQTRSGCWCK
jgi:hypothetical protein